MCIHYMQAPSYWITGHIILYPVAVIELYIDQTRWDNKPRERIMHTFDLPTFLPKCKCNVTGCNLDRKAPELVVRRCVIL